MANLLKNVMGPIYLDSCIYECLSMGQILPNYLQGTNLATKIFVFIYTPQTGDVLLDFKQVVFVDAILSALLLHFVDVPGDETPHDFIILALLRHWRVRRSLWDRGNQISRAKQQNSRRLRSFPRRSAARWSWCRRPAKHKSARQQSACAHNALKRDRKGPNNATGSTPAASRLPNAATAAPLTTRRPFSAVAGRGMLTLGDLGRLYSCASSPWMAFTK